jgi:tetratricopeptide (TPR) repeat protein
MMNARRKPSGGRFYEGMMKQRSLTRRGRKRGQLVAWIAVLVLVAGCSGGANPVNRLKARVQLKNGNVRYLAGQYEQAIRNYDAALRYVPRLAPAYLNRAYSKEALTRVSGNPQTKQALAAEAVDSFQKYLGLLDHGAIGLDSKSPGPERIEEHILTLLVDSQQIDQAVAHLQARFDRNPRDVSALEMLSRLELERGQLDAAMEWQRKRVEVAPQDPDAQYSLGAFVWLMSYRDAGMDPAKRAALLDEGMAALQRAIAIRPDDFETLIYVNLLYLEKAKYAATDAERGAFEAQAKVFRDRALALRKTTDAAAAADTTAPAPATP